MVRNLVGLLLSVGMGQITPDEIPGSRCVIAPACHLLHLRMASAGASL